MQAENNDRPIAFSTHEAPRETSCVRLKRHEANEREQSFPLNRLESDSRS